MKARLDTKRVFALYHPYGLLTSPKAKIYNSANTLLATLTLVSSTTVANLHISNSPTVGTGYIFTKSGTYTVKYEHSPGGVATVIGYETIEVGRDPVSDITLSTTATQQFTISKDIIGDTTSTVTLKILKSADTIVGSASYTATYDAALASYKVTGPAISAEDLYFLVWYDDGALETVVQKLAFIPVEHELIKLTVVNVDGGSVPWQTTTALFSRKSDGIPITEVITSTAGAASLSLPPDTYIITLAKSGTVFSTNNFEVVIVNSRATGTANNVNLNTEGFVPTFAPVSNSLNVCTLYADLYEFDGVPMRDTEILVSLFQGPQNYSGIGAFGTSKVYRTDKNGHVSFALLQGIKVEVAIMAHALRRIITVPSGAAAAAPVNLLTLVSAASDPFDIIVVNLPTPARR